MENARLFSAGEVTQCGNKHGRTRNQPGMIPARIRPIDGNMGHGFWLHLPHVIVFGWISTKPFWLLLCQPFPKSARMKAFLTVIGDRHLAKSLKLMHFPPTPNVMQWKLIQKQWNHDISGIWRYWGMDRFQGINSTLCYIKSHTHTSSHSYPFMAAWWWLTSVSSTCWSGGFLKLVPPKLWSRKKVE